MSSVKSTHMRLKSIALIVAVGLTTLLVGAPAAADSAPSPTPTAEQSTDQPTDVPAAGESTPSNEETPTPAPAEDLQVHNIDGGTVTQGDSKEITLRAEGGSDPLKFSVGSVSPAGSGEVSVRGSIATFTASSSAKGTVSFPFTVKDGSGNEQTARVNMTVEQPANPPKAQPYSPGKVTQGKTINFNLPKGTGGTGPLTYALAKAPSASQGKVTVGKDGHASFTAGSSYTGRTSFTYTVSDSKDTSEPATVTLTVEGASSEPSPEPSPTTPEPTTPDSSSSPIPSDSPTSPDKPTTGEPTTSPAPGTGHSQATEWPSSSENSEDEWWIDDSGDPEPSEDPSATSTPISVPTAASTGSSGLDSGGVDNRDLGMGGLVVGASALLFLGIRKLQSPEK